MQHRTTDTREFRVFLSSTFRDMQHERDLPINEVIPEIQQPYIKCLINL